jgi:predicted enzyme related to lactoylglutathione lyase
MPNPVMRWQILTKCPEKLEQFYTAMFGWSVSADNPLGYKQVNTRCLEGIAGGFWPISANEGQSMVQLFIRVDDLESHVRKAQELGARIVVPPQTLPGGEEMAIAVDPDGISFGMFRTSSTTQG